MHADLLIKGGVIVDPDRGFHGLGDVVVQDGMVVDAPLHDLSAAKVIDAENCLVVPGLIDFHAHIFSPGTRNSVWADSALLPQGVTSVVDAGTAGSNNYDTFVRTVPAFNQMRVFSLVNVSAAGLVSLPFCPENVDPGRYDISGLKSLFVKYQGQLKGLKIRQSRDIVGELGLEPLKATVRLAQQIGCPVVVHVTNPPCVLTEIADLLRPGDVFCHVYQSKGSTIIGDDGKVLSGIKLARGRGVIFDVANGISHFSFAVCRAAIADGFLPDVISTDLTTKTLYLDYAFGLPYLMSKFLSLGVDLMEVVAACTSTPAKLLGMQGRLGTLRSGSLADIAVLKPIRRSTQFRDALGEIFVGEQLLVPQMTVLGGRIVYRQTDFAT
jgi:predicted amidohydrolase